MTVNMLPISTLLLSLALIALVLVAPGPARAGVTFLSPSELANRTYHAPEWVCPQSPAPSITGRLLCLHALVNLLPNVTIEQLKENYTNSILFVSTTHILEGDYPPLYKLGSPERVLLDFVRIFNFSAIFTHNTAAVVGSTAEVLVADRSWCPSLGIPILETGLNWGPELMEMCKSNATANPIIVTLTSGDYNEWMYLKRGWFMIVWRIVATLMAATAGSLAGGVQFFAALFRIGIVSIDPIYAGLNFGATEAHMTSTISFPLNFITILLLALYWTEMLDASKIHITHFLTRLKIPFIISSVLLVAAELFSTLLRAIPYTGVKVSFASTISAVLYIVFMLTMSVIFFIFGFKVIRRLRQTRIVSNMKGGEKKTDASLRRMTVMLFATGLFNVVFISAFLIAAVDSVFYSPKGFHASWTLMYVGVLGASIAQVAAVKWPDPRASNKLEGHSSTLSNRIVSVNNSATATTDSKVSEGDN